jgi:fructokinase
VTQNPIPERDSVDVLVVGEALIDIIESRGELSEHVGGSPANVALGLGRLGVNTTLLTSLGRDPRGFRIANRLRSAGVSLRPESWGVEPTSTAHARLGADGAATYNFNISWALPDDVAVPETRVVHIGSIGAFLRPGAQRVIELLRALPDEVVVSFDPNIRAEVIGDRSDAIATFDVLVALSDCLKLSDEDAEWIFPGLSHAEVLQELAAADVSFSALTRGSAGAMLRNARSIVEVPSLPVSKVDTVGAGDTFMASLIHSSLDIELGDASADVLEQVGRRAATASAITVSRPGADLPTEAEVDAALRDLR